MHLPETLLLWSHSEFQNCNSAVLGLSGRCLPAQFQFRDADSTPVQTVILEILSPKRALLGYLPFSEHKWALTNESKSVLQNLGLERLCCFKASFFFFFLFKSQVFIGGAGIVFCSLLISEVPEGMSEPELPKKGPQPYLGTEGPLDDCL